MSNVVTKDMVIGIDEDHLVLFKDNIYVHKDIKEPLLKLIEIAKYDNINLTIASGYRSFKRQELIWNEKMSGIRPIYDEKVNSINTANLSIKERVQAILKWSAPPGLSRHHFGTDLDIYDKNKTITNNYKLQLIPEEYSATGIFKELSTFLDKNLNKKSSFFRPYTQNSNTVLAEPWHISFKPIADKFEKQLDLDFLAQTIYKSNIIGKEYLDTQFLKDNYDI
jgi:LAS superfamily LD-carboxypeptidase LdcB